MAPRIVVTMPTSWLVHGFVESVRRLSAVADESPSENARDIAIAAFEATNWLDAIHEQEHISGDPRIRALLFARKRLHHQVVGGMYFDQTAAAWVWYPPDNFPIPEERFRDAAGESVYREHLARRPILDSFEHARCVLEKRWPIAQ